MGVLTEIKGAFVCDDLDQYQRSRITRILLYQSPVRGRGVLPCMGSIGMCGLKWKRVWEAGHTPLPIFFCE